jgi:hypothetical protein
MKELASLENLDHTGPADASCDRPQSLRAAAGFDRIIFADKHRCNHYQGVLGDPA